MRRRTEDRLIVSWVAVGIGSLVIVLVMPFGRAEAGDWSLMVMTNSWHRAGGHTCNGVEQDFNEDNRGLIVRYKNLIVGRYENSYSNCGCLRE